MLIKKIFGVLLLLAMIALPQTTSAEKTDWFERGYNFRNIRTIILFDTTFNPSLGYGNSIEARNLQDTYEQNSRKLKCNVITEAQARRTIGYELGINLDSMAYSNPAQARQIIMQNAYRIADAWVLANVDNLANTYYVEPARTVWEERRETSYYYDSRGRRHEEVHYIQVPVTYPPRRVDVTSIQMSMQVYEARTGAVIFARKDVRDRQEYQAQKGMFGRITNSFFEDVGKKIRG